MKTHVTQVTLGITMSDQDGSAALVQAAGLPSQSTSRNDLEGNDFSSFFRASDAPNNALFTDVQNMASLL
jgi:hypothetical protein